MTVSLMGTLSSSDNFFEEEPYLRAYVPFTCPILFVAAMSVVRYTVLGVYFSPFHTIRNPGLNRGGQALILVFPDPAVEALSHLLLDMPDNYLTK